MATIHTYCKNEKQISDHQLFTNFWINFFAYINMDFCKKVTLEIYNSDQLNTFLLTFFPDQQVRVAYFKKFKLLLDLFSCFNVSHFQMTIFCQPNFCQNRKKALSAKVELFCKVYIKSSHVKTLNQSFLRPYCKEIKKSNSKKKVKLRY